MCERWRTGYEVLEVAELGRAEYFGTQDHMFDALYRKGLSNQTGKRQRTE